MIRLLSFSLLLVAVLFSGIAYGDTGIKWELIKNGKVIKVLNNRDQNFQDGNWVCSAEAPITASGVSFRDVYCRNVINGAILRDTDYCGAGLNRNLTYPMSINGNEYQLLCTLD